MQLMSCCFLTSFVPVCTGCSSARPPRLAPAPAPVQLRGREWEGARWGPVLWMCYKAKWWVTRQIRPGEAAVNSETYGNMAQLLLFWYILGDIALEVQKKWEINRRRTCITWSRCIGCITALVRLIFSCLRLVSQMFITNPSSEIPDLSIPSLSFLIKPSLVIEDWRQWKPEVR